MEAKSKGVSVDLGGLASAAHLRLARTLDWFVVLDSMTSTASCLT
jgi:hypothetical protein